MLARPAAITHTPHPRHTRSARRKRNAAVTPVGVGNHHDAPHASTNAAGSAKNRDALLLQHCRATPREREHARRPHQHRPLQPATNPALRGRQAPKARPAKQILHAQRTRTHAPRREPSTDAQRRLEERHYWDKRERERERCVSAADASTYGTLWAHNDSRHVCPRKTHAKTTPLHAVQPSPYYVSPVKRLKPTQEARPKPDLSMPNHPLTESYDNKNVPHTQSLVKSEPSCLAPYSRKPAPASAYRL